MKARAVFFGCSGFEVTPDERKFFRDADPLGFILFSRNCQNPQQMQALTSQLRDCVGRADAPVLIDQEGGRVQRMKAPHWRSRPAARRFAELYAEYPERAVRLSYLNARAMAQDLLDAGVTVDCAPVLDVPVEGAHDVIGDRAFGTRVPQIVALGRAQMRGLLDGGVLPVIKHIPGHGRARSDSHLELPVVDTSAAELSATDFAPFRHFADAPFAMTAHVVYTALDASAPATTSARVIGEIIRGLIGYDGCLMTDDLSMRALSGDFARRAEASIQAGCDLVLHCNGQMSEMTAVAAGTPMLSGDALRRTTAALAQRKAPKPADHLSFEAELAQAFGAQG